MLSVGGILYTITDVAELGDWIQTHLNNHSMFERLSDEELLADPIVPQLTATSEEGQKVTHAIMLNQLIAHLRQPLSMAKMNLFLILRMWLWIYVWFDFFSALSLSDSRFIIQ